MTRNKKIVISIISLLVIVFAVGLMKKNPRAEYEIDKLQRRDLIQTVEASGTVNPVQTVSIGSQVSGMIKEIYVDYNSKVKKGQLLAEIDTSLFQAQVDQATANLNSKKATYLKIKKTLDYNKANYKRYNALYAKNYISKNDLELAKSTYLSKNEELIAAKADIDQATASLQNSLTNLRYTKIVSPVDGVVISKEVDVGQTVAASFQTPTLFAVAQDLTKMLIEVNVSEADIGKLKEGQRAYYTLDGYPDERFEGVVSQVRLSPTTVSNVVTYTVVVSVENDNNVLKPGMTANVEFITKESKNVLTVPNRAFKFIPKGSDKRYETQGVWILDKNKLTRVDVKSGASSDAYTEVISDKLTDGMQVVIGLKNEKDKGKQKGSMRHPPM